MQHSCECINQKQEKIIMIIYHFGIQHNCMQIILFCEAQSVHLPIKLLYIFFIPAVKW